MKRGEVLDYSTYIPFSYQYEVRNSSLQLAALEQQKADEDFMKLAEDQKVCWHMCFINHQVISLSKLESRESLICNF